MNEPRPTLSVVIPLRNEEDHLEVLLEALDPAIDATGLEAEIVLVDDGSTDGTWEAIRRQTGRRSRLGGLRLSRHFGKEAALCAGLEAARGDAVVVMDGDMQHPPALLPEMVRRWRDTGCDVVEAVRRGGRRGSFLRRGLNAVFYGLLRRLSGYDLRHASDYKLLGPRARQAWLRLGERNLFFRGMVAWMGFRRQQVPFDVPARPHGRTRWGALPLLRLGATGITAFSSAPLRLAGILGAVFFLFALGLGAHTLWMKFSGRAVEGFTTVIVLLLLIGSLLMMVLAIIGEYLARIYEEVKGRPRYLVAEEVRAPTDDGVA